MYSIVLMMAISGSADALPVDVGGCHGRAVVGFAVRPVVVVRSLFLSTGCAGSALAPRGTGCHGVLLFPSLRTRLDHFVNRPWLMLGHVSTGCAGSAVQAVPPPAKLPEPPKKK